MVLDLIVVVVGVGVVQGHMEQLEGIHLHWMLILVLENRKRDAKEEMQLDPVTRVLGLGSFLVFLFLFWTTTLVDPAWIRQRAWQRDSGLSSLLLLFYFSTHTERYLGEKKKKKIRCCSCFYRAETE